VWSHGKNLFYVGKGFPFSVVKTNGAMELNQIDMMIAIKSGGLFF
jgi:hypothetical protein